MALLTFPPTVHVLSVGPVCSILNDGHSQCVRGYLSVVLICVSLIIRDGEPFFKCLLAIIHFLRSSVHSNVECFVYMSVEH